MKRKHKNLNVLAMAMKAHFVFFLVFFAVVLPISAYGDTPPNISWVGPRITSYRYSGGVMVGFVTAPHFINEGGPGTIEISARIEKDGSLHSTFETKYFPVQAGRDYKLFIEGDCGGACTFCPYPFMFLELIIDSPSAAYPLDLPVLLGPLYPWAYASITNIELRQDFSNYLLLSTGQLTIAEGATATFTVSLRLDPLGTLEVAVANESGDTDITVESGASLVFDSSNYSVPQSVTLRAAEDGDRFNGTASIAVTAPWAKTRRVTVTERDNEPYVNIALVDADAPGANDGSSWADAFTDLQAALSFAAGFTHFEVRVAQGVYKPVGPSGARAATFQLLEGVAVRGGYAGFGELDPDARDINKYETVLSGDLTGNDVPVADPFDLLDEPTRAENSYHVVTGSGTDANAVLDGFIITAGNANGTSDPNDEYGGGLLNEINSSPTIIDCTFFANSAFMCGGGMASDINSSPTVTNCTFSSNSAEFSGGMHIDVNSSSIVINCTFTDNRARSDGGGLLIYQGNPYLVNCTFSGNLAGKGGGMANYSYSSPTVTDCIFSGNSADDYGGGMFNKGNSSPMVIGCLLSNNSADCGGGMLNDGGSPTLTNCSFIANSADSYGGGIFEFDNNPTVIGCAFSGNVAGICGGGTAIEDSTATLVNCTFSGNAAVNGNALACDSEPQTPSNVEIANCILWDGGSEIWNNDGSTITITYSDIQDSWLGEGNINADPYFVQLGCWVDANDPNIIVEPNDPNAMWVDGNYRLRPDSPCTDAADNTAVPSGVTTDLDGKPRFVDDLCTTDTGNPPGADAIVDMGAYEFLRSDIDSNGAVDLVDFSRFALYWKESGCGACGGADLTCDGDVDLYDLKEFGDNWLAGVSN